MMKVGMFDLLPRKAPRSHISLHLNCAGKPEDIGLLGRLRWQPEVQFADWTCRDWHKSITSAAESVKFGVSVPFFSDFSMSNV